MTTLRMLDALPEVMDPVPAALAGELLDEVRAVIAPQAHELRHTIRINKSTMDRAGMCPRRLAAPDTEVSPDAVLLGNLVDLAHQVRSRCAEISSVTAVEWCRLASLVSEEFGLTLQQRIEDDADWWGEAAAHLAALDAMLPDRRWLTEVPVQAALAPGVIASLRLDGLITVDGVGCTMELKSQHSRAESSARNRVGDVNVGALLASTTYDLPIGVATILVTNDASVETHRIDEAHLEVAAQRLTDATEVAIRVHHAKTLDEIPAIPGGHCAWCALAGHGCDEGAQ